MRKLFTFIFLIATTTTPWADPNPAPAVFIEGKGENGFSVAVLKEYGDIRREVVRRLDCLDIWSAPDPVLNARVFTCDDIEFFFDATSSEFVFKQRVDNGAISASIRAP